MADTVWGLRQQTSYCISQTVSKVAPPTEPTVTFMKGEKMKDSNYIVVQGWMCNELKLAGNELLVYALIYGFSQDGESWYNGSRRYISETINVSMPTVDKALKGLVSKGLIVKEEKSYNGMPIIRYQASLQGIKNFDRGCKDFLQGCKDFLHNKDINNSNEKPRYKKSKPTVDDIRQYCIERNNGIDAQQFFDFYESKGWMVGRNPMKDWKACVRTWERRSNGLNANSKKAIPNFTQRDYDYASLEDKIFNQ